MKIFQEDDFGNVDCHMGCSWKVTVGAGRGKDQTISVLQRQRDEGLDRGSGTGDPQKENAFLSDTCPFVPGIA